MIMHFELVFFRVHVLHQVGQDEDNIEAEVREKQCMAAVSKTQ